MSSNNAFEGPSTSLNTHDDISRLVEGPSLFLCDAYVKVNGARTRMSLKDLLPSQTQEFLVASGGNDPVLTIECDRLVQGQAIQFEADLTGD